MALKYTINLPPAGASDVASREVTVVVDAAPPEVTVLPGDAATFVRNFEHGQNVSVTLVDVDAADNRSPPSPALGFTATDTFPPPAPGALAVGDVEQVP
jgi:hypothetical protein